MRSLKTLAMAVLMLGLSKKSSALTVKSDLTVFSFQSLPVQKTDGSTLPFYTNETLTVDASEIPVWGAIKLRASLGVERRDLRAISTLDKNQAVVPRASTSEQAVTTDLEASYLKGNWDAKIGIFFPLNSTLQSERGVSAGLRRGLYYQTTWLSLDSTFIEKRGPQDYFIDRDLRTKARPRSVNGVELGLSWEQIYSEFWKSKLRFVTRSLKEERPRSYGLELNQVLALSSRIFLSPQAAYYREFQSESLRNERGYFTAFSTKVELSVEPFYDWILSGSYGLTVEREYDPRVQTREQVGADQFALALLYQRPQLSFRFQAQTLRSNRGNKNYGVTGGFKWQI